MIPYEKHWPLLRDDLFVNDLYLPVVDLKDVLYVHLKRPVKDVHLILLFILWTILQKNRQLIISLRCVW